MKEITFICIGCIFLFVGGFIALLNWYHIIVWTWRRRNKPNYKKHDSVIPFIGGIILAVGMIFLLSGLPHEVVKGKLWLAYLPWIVDYGSFPTIVISPLLGMLISNKRKVASNKKG